jgi:3-deoxy-manno-octulosonate cytidylyltransferase (CMP-KDO synthetase)
MTTQDFFVVIPARYSSSRFPGKPLSEIRGIPMIKMVYDIVFNSGKPLKVIVATDDMRIYDYCTSENINVIMTSDAHLTGTDRLGEVSNMIDSEYYINLQGDEPLFEYNNLVLGINAAKKFPGTIINFGSEINSKDLHNPSIVKVRVNDENFADSFYRNYNSDELTYYRTLKHLGVYIIHRDILKVFAKLEQSENEKLVGVEMYRFLDHGFPIKLVEIVTRSIGVDNPEDIKKIEKIMKNRD